MEQKTLAATSKVLQPKKHRDGGRLPVGCFQRYVYVDHVTNKSASNEVLRGYSSTSNISREPNLLSVCQDEIGAHPSMRLSQGGGSSHTRQRSAGKLPRPMQLDAASPAVFFPSPRDVDSAVETLLSPARDKGRELRRRSAALVMAADSAMCSEQKLADTQARLRATQIRSNEILSLYTSRCKDVDSSKSIAGRWMVSEKESSSDEDKQGTAEDKNETSFPTYKEGHKHAAVRIQKRDRGSQCHSNFDIEGHQMSYNRALDAVETRGRAKVQSICSEQIKAATLIQSRSRGMSVRSQLAYSNRASQFQRDCTWQEQVALELNMEGVSGNCNADEVKSWGKREHQAAIRIQARHRGICGRQRIYNLRRGRQDKARAATLIQASLRGMSVRRQMTIAKKPASSHDSSTSQEQPVFGSYASVHTCSSVGGGHQHEAAIRIQARHRGIRGRQDVQNIRTDQRKREKLEGMSESAAASREAGDSAVVAICGAPGLNILHQQLEEVQELLEEEKFAHKQTKENDQSLEAAVQDFERQLQDADETLADEIFAHQQTRQVSGDLVQLLEEDIKSLQAGAEIREAKYHGALSILRNELHHALSLNQALEDKIRTLAVAGKIRMVETMLSASTSSPEIAPELTMDAPQVRTLVLSNHSATQTSLVAIIDREEHDDREQASGWPRTKGQILTDLENDAKLDTEVAMEGFKDMYSEEKREFELELERQRQRVASLEEALKVERHRVGEMIQRVKKVLELQEREQRQRIVARTEETRLRQELRIESETLTLVRWERWCARDEVRKEKEGRECDQKRIVELETLVANMMRKLEHLEEELTTERESVEQVLRRDMTCNAESKLQESETEKHVLEAQLSAAKEAIMELKKVDEERRIVLEEQVKAATKWVGDVEVKMRDAVGPLEEELRKEKKGLTKLEFELGTLKDKITMTEQENRDGNARIASLVADLNIERERLASVEKREEERMNDMSKALKEARDKVAEVGERERSKRRILGVELMAAREKLACLEASLTSKMAEIDSPLLKERQRVAALQEKVSRLVEMHRQSTTALKMLLKAENATLEDWTDTAALRPDTPNGAVQDHHRAANKNSALGSSVSTLSHVHTSQPRLPAHTIFPSATRSFAPAPHPPSVHLYKPQNVQLLSPASSPTNESGKIFGRFSEQSRAGAGLRDTRVLRVMSLD